MQKLDKQQFIYLGFDFLYFYKIKIYLLFIVILNKKRYTKYTEKAYLRISN